MNAEERLRLDFILVDPRESRRICGELVGEPPRTARTQRRDRGGERADNWDPHVSEVCTGIELGWRGGIERLGRLISDQTRGKTFFLFSVPISFSTISIC